MEGHEIFSNDVGMSEYEYFETGGGKYMSNDPSHSQSIKSKLLIRSAFVCCVLSFKPKRQLSSNERAGLLGGIQDENITNLLITSRAS